MIEWLNISINIIIYFAVFQPDDKETIKLKLIK